jgi:hypothetical protein
LTKLTSTHGNIHAPIRVGKPSGRVEKRKKEYRRVSDASFQEVEEHKHNLVSLSGFLI